MFMCTKFFGRCAEQEDIMCASSAPRYGAGRWHRKRKDFAFAVNPDPGLEIGFEPRLGSDFFFKNFLLACGRPNLEWLKLKETSAPPATPILGRPRSGLAQPRRKTHTVAQGIFSPLFFKIYFILYFIYIKKIKNKNIF